MSKAYTLPFHVAPELLPSLLPSLEEIETTTDLLKEEDVRGHRFVRIGRHFVVKHGEHVSLIEGENMLFAKGTTNVLFLERFTVRLQYLHMQTSNQRTSS
jgi:hypothetical protein